MLRWLALALVLTFASAASAQTVSMEEQSATVPNAWSQTFRYDFSSRVNSETMDFTECIDSYIARWDPDIAGNNRNARFHFNDCNSTTGQCVDTWWPATNQPETVFPIYGDRLTIIVDTAPDPGETARVEVVCQSGQYRWDDVAKIWVYEAQYQGGTGGLPPGAEGDILINTAGSWAVLNPGLAGYVLTMNDSPRRPTWSSPTGGGGSGNILDGTSIGDVTYWDGTQWTPLIPGTAGECLQTNGVGSAPSWVTCGSSVSVNGGTVSNPDFGGTPAPSAPAGSESATWGVLGSAIGAFYRDWSQDQTPVQVLDANLPATITRDSEVPGLEQDTAALGALTSHKSSGDHDSRYFVDTTLNPTTEAELEGAVRGINQKVLTDADGLCGPTEALRGVNPDGTSNCTDIATDAAVLYALSTTDMNILDTIGEAVLFDSSVTIGTGLSYAPGTGTFTIDIPGTFAMTAILGIEFGSANACREWTWVETTAGSVVGGRSGFALSTAGGQGTASNQPMAYDVVEIAEGTTPRTFQVRVTDEDVFCNLSNVTPLWQYSFAEIRQEEAGVGTGGGGGAPVDSSYVTINAEPSLSSERVVSSTTPAAPAGSVNVTAQSTAGNLSFYTTDWTADQGATNIHPGNYVESDPIYSTAPASSITDAGSGAVITAAERSGLHTKTTDAAEISHSTATDVCARFDATGVLSAAAQDCGTGSGGGSETQPPTVADVIQVSDGAGAHKDSGARIEADANGFHMVVPVRTTVPAAPAVGSHDLFFCTAGDGSLCKRSNGDAGEVVIGPGSPTTFAALLGGENTSAAMVVGTGSSLIRNGGTIDASLLSGQDLASVRNHAPAIHALSHQSGQSDVLNHDDLGAVAVEQHYQWVRRPTNDCESQTATERTYCTQADGLLFECPSSCAGTGWVQLGGGATVPAHDLGGAEHNADTLANFNTKLTDATLYDGPHTVDDPTAGGVNVVQASDGADGHLSTGIIYTNLAQHTGAITPGNLTQGSTATPKDLSDSGIAAADVVQASSNLNQRTLVQGLGGSKSVQNSAMVLCSTFTPADTNALTYDGTNTCWEPGTTGGAGTDYTDGVTTVSNATRAVFNPALHEIQDNGGGEAAINPSIDATLLGPTIEANETAGLMVLSGGAQSVTGPVDFQGGATISGAFNPTGTRTAGSWHEDWQTATDPGAALAGGFTNFEGKWKQHGDEFHIKFTATYSGTGGAAVTIDLSSWTGAPNRVPLSTNNVGEVVGSCSFIQGAEFIRDGVVTEWNVALAASQTLYVAARDVNGVLAAANTSASHPFATAWDNQGRMTCSFRYEAQ